MLRTNKHGAFSLSSAIAAHSALMILFSYLLVAPGKRTVFADTKASMEEEMAVANAGASFKIDISLFDVSLDAMFSMASFIDAWCFMQCWTRCLKKAPSPNNANTKSVSRHSSRRL